jgi:hypothetical protein
MSMAKTLYNAARCLDETVYYKKYLLDNLNLYFSNKRLELNEVLTGFSIPTAIGVIDEKTGKRVSIEPTNPYEAMKVVGWLVVNHFFNSKECPDLWKVNKHKKFFKI